ncbi:hypothetical protein [Enterobacter pseudoroggenkampii]|uniref:hypothetical protein n=1 Tax=Enterobacter pseudoroggenkampii TaxID=2996112 RepID=UPI0022646E58|nr:hypothetical protein [Enterobacter pseudoroggenkampii]MCX8289111.1 hypothetical protein [Enterobacter pseudoroggenkampii]
MENSYTPADNDAYDFFLSLEDVNGTGFEADTKALIESEREARAAEKANSIVEDDDSDVEAVEDYETPDWDFLEENPGAFDDGDAPEQEEESQAEEVAETADNDHIDDSDIDDGDDYDYSVDEDTTLNLPDGRIMSIGELQAKALSDDAYKAREEEFNQRVSNFEAQYQAAKDTLEVAELECDKVLNQYNSWDWDELYENNPVQFAEEKRYYDKMIKRKNMLIQEQAKIKAQQEQAQHEAFSAQSRACVQVLKASIPEWTDQLYESLMQYAVTEYNEDPEDVLKWNKPNDFIRLYKLYKYEKGVQKAKASLKGAKKGGKFLSSNGNRSKVTDEAKLNKIASDFNKGKLSNSDVFSFLQD